MATRRVSSAPLGLTVKFSLFIRDLSTAFTMVHYYDIFVKKEENPV